MDIIDLCSDSSNDDCDNDKFTSNLSNLKGIPNGLPKSKASNGPRNEPTNIFKSYFNFKNSKLFKLPDLTNGTSDYFHNPLREVNFQKYLKEPPPYVVANERNTLQPAALVESGNNTTSIDTFLKDYFLVDPNKDKEYVNFTTSTPKPKKASKFNVHNTIPSTLPKNHDIKLPPPSTAKKKFDIKLSSKDCKSFLSDYGLSLVQSFIDVSSVVACSDEDILVEDSLQNSVYQNHNSLSLSCDSLHVVEETQILKSKASPSTNLQITSNSLPKTFEDYLKGASRIQHRLAKSISTNNLENWELSDKSFVDRVNNSTTTNEVEILSDTSNITRIDSTEMGLSENAYLCTDEAADLKSLQIFRLSDTSHYDVNINNDNKNNSTLCSIHENKYYKLLQANYSDMVDATPNSRCLHLSDLELRKEASKYGVKRLSKTKLIKILSAIYNFQDRATHTRPAQTTNDNILNAFLSSKNFKSKPKAYKKLNSKELKRSLSKNSKSSVAPLPTLSNKSLELIKNQELVVSICPLESCENIPEKFRSSILTGPENHVNLISSPPSQLSRKNVFRHQSISPIQLSEEEVCLNDTDHIPPLFERINYRKALSIQTPNTSLEVLELIPEEEVPIKIPHLGKLIIKPDEEDVGLRHLPYHTTVSNLDISDQILYDFVVTDRQIYKSVLLYEPLWLDRILEQLNTSYLPSLSYYQVTSRNGKPNAVDAECVSNAKPTPSNISFNANCEIGREINKFKSKVKPSQKKVKDVKIYYVYKKCSKPRLVSFLDSKCITFRFPPINLNGPTKKKKRIYKI